jgi:ferredoxin, 2Fe-2S
MTKIVFEHYDGRIQEVEADAGSSFMQAALHNNVEGIVAECGGFAACATCHVYVLDGPRELLPEMTIQESQVLDCAATERQPNSRLSCQLIVPSGEGIFVVRLPERQQ